MTLQEVTFRPLQLGLFPAHKITLFLLLLLLLHSPSALQIHEQTQPVVYSQALYLKELTLIQQKFATDLLKIQGTFAQLNSYLNNTNVSSSSEVVKLQQTLAQESNSLYNIQTFLNVPFALKSCECLNFTVKQRDQLQVQLNKVNSQIKVLEVNLYQNTSGSPYINVHCPGGNCPVVNQIRSSIAQLRNYATIMNDTLNSNCCNRTVYLFRDNLLSYSFWIYGNTTYSKYQAALLARANGTKMATCPSSLPFVNVSTNGCFACPPARPIYDLGLGRCVPPCAKGLVLDVKLHQCAVNKSCPFGEYWNNATQKCEVSLGSSSRCPLTRPYFNVSSLSCQLCPNGVPYFDVAIRSCRACTVNEVFDPFNRVCYSKINYHPIACPPGTLFNIATGKCQVLPNTTTTTASNTTIPATATAGTTTACPSYAPYWNSVALSCSKCPPTKPYFSPATSRCEPCPANTQWNAAISICVSLTSLSKCGANQYWDSILLKCLAFPNCTSSQFFNNVTKRCQNLAVVGKTGFCPPSAPHWNPLSLACQKCPLATPLFNQTAKICEPCPTGSSYDLATNTCKSNSSCPVGTLYNTSSNKCEKVICSGNTPIFDTVTKNCVGCPSGTTYNAISKVCELPLTQQQAVTSVCPPARPYYNPGRLACEVCPLGQRVDPVSLLCVAGVSHLLGVESML